ncbi:Uncharacterized protein NEOC65_000564 [Neochlamydia sp. AcF65]|nr:Uncharacterized protein [Neochlamydia sp. AcF65]
MDLLKQFKKGENMKILLSFLGAFFMAISFLSADSNMNNCKCSECSCTQDKHCGCYTQSGCQGLSSPSEGKEPSQEKDPMATNKDI